MVDEDSHWTEIQAETEEMAQAMSEWFCSLSRKKAKKMRKTIKKNFVVILEVYTDDYYYDLYTCEQMKEKVKEVLESWQFRYRVAAVKTKRKKKIIRKKKERIIVERRLKD